MEMKRELRGAAFGLGVLALTAGFQARAELVYEANQQDRELTRQALIASERMQASNPVVVQTPVQVPVQAPAQVVVSPPTQVVAAPPAQIVTAPPAVQVVSQPTIAAVPAPVVAQAPAVMSAVPLTAVAPTEEVQSLSKSELVRRERVRAELRNEDILQERLEELRLRDERRRTEQLVNNTAVTPQDSAVAVVAAPVTTPIREERVGTLAAAPMPVAAVPANTKVASAAAVIQQDQIAAQVGAPASVAVIEPTEEKTMVYVMPKAGVGSYTSNVGAYELNPRFSLGVALGVDVSNNLSFEMGYTYSEYGLSLGGGYNNYLPVAYGYYQNNELYALKQNVVDAGLRLYFLGRDAKLRPFLGGGGAYARSFLNYDRSLYNNWDVNQYGTDYDLIQYLGFLSTGFDIRVNKSISVGTMFKYYGVLSSRENRNSYYGLPGLPTEYDKQMTGNALQKMGFYSVTGGISFVF